MFLRRFRHLFRSKDKDELRLPFVCTVWYTVKIDTLTNEIKAFRNSTFMTTIYFTEIQEGRDQIIISRNALLPIYPAWSAFNTYYNLVKRYCEGFFSILMQLHLQFLQYPIYHGIIFRYITGAYK